MWQSHLSEKDSSKNGVVLEVFRPLHSEWFACCAPTIQYMLYSTVGRSIASISDLSEHIYLGTSVVYISYGPPYCTIYITYSTYINYTEELINS